MTDEACYKAIFDEAMQLVGEQILLDGPPLPNLTLVARRRLKKAARLLAQAAEVEPSYGAASLMAGKIEQRLGNPERAIYWFRKAMVVAPENVIVALELGTTLSKQGHQTEAIQVLSEAAASNPEDPRIQSNLGVALLLACDTAMSIETFKHLISLEPARAMNKRLLDFAQHVQAGRNSPPKNWSDLERSV